MSNNNSNNNTAKSTACTVFVRFIPPTSSVRRHHLEALFSEIGPIKKSSVIHNSKKDSKSKEDAAAPPVASSYAFVKYTDEADAVTASKKLNHAMLQVSPTEKVQVKVELASAAAQQKAQKGSAKPATTAAAAAASATATTAASSQGAKKAKSAATENAATSTDAAATSKQERDSKRGAAHSNSNDSTMIQQDEVDHDDPAYKKRSCRLILRNLSFYAKESHIRKALEPKFGRLTEVHIPTIHTKDKDNKAAGGAPTTHRGFCFVTFDQEVEAQKCLDTAEEIVICKRPVRVAHSENKTAYDSKKEQIENDKKKKAKKDRGTKRAVEEEDDIDDDSDSDQDDDASDDSDMEEASDDDSDSSDDDDDDDDEEKRAVKELEKGNKKAKVGPDEALAHKLTLFVRNLPFDATRHDLFEIFHKFGYVTTIYLVKDKQTGIPKGTAFVTFQKPESAQKALDAASDQDSFVSQREGANNTEDANKDAGQVSGIMCKGRRLFANLAVDKETASTLTVEKGKDANKLVGKDRRNLYLKGEGRVDNNANAREGSQTAWDDLPEGDQLKRQQAWSDKNTKLRSPIFSINPTRLSFRNMSKHVDEVDFKRVCVEATLLGLEKNLVNAEDQIAHWKAQGEMTTRDILARMQELGGDENKKAIIPEFDEGNVKRFIPSVFIDRDFSVSKKKTEAPSRGFGFVDFEHHLHALACLRELNNNPKYSDEFVTGGKHASEAKRRAVKRNKKGADAKQSDFVGKDGKAKLPRLVVEFAVENVVKAKQQAEHRSHQQSNIIKQKIDTREAGKKKQEKKQSRGKLQREKKRKQREGGAPVEASKTKADDAKDSKSASVVSTEKAGKGKAKLAKPPKKQKIDKEEETFTNLVETYKQAFAAPVVDEKQAAANKKSEKKERRWFE
jgi:nucleolar protein 4